MNKRINSERTWTICVHRVQRPDFLRIILPEFRSCSQD